MRFFSKVFGVLVFAVIVLAGWFSMPVTRSTAVATRKGNVFIEESRGAAPHFSGKVHFDLLAKLIADDRRSAADGDWLRRLMAEPATMRVPSESHPLSGQPAPDFTLEDQEGHRWTLREHLAQGPVVLVFYLGYLCNACVHDLFELDADIDRFRQLGATIAAISADPPAHTRQKEREYGAFEFAVLFDPDHSVGAVMARFRKPIPGRPAGLLHATFVVARDGKVQWATFGDRPFGNNRALLCELACLQHDRPAMTLATSRDEEAKSP